jgi:hypothetical protein
MDNPLHYGFHYRKKDLYPPLSVQNISIDTTISDLATFALSLDINYKILKYYNPWLRQNTLTITEGKKYVLQIPKPGSRDLDKIWIESGLLNEEIKDSTSNNNTH